MCFYSKAHFKAVTTRDIWQWWLPNTCNWKAHNCSGSLLTRGQREGKGRGSFPGVSKRKDCHWDLGGGDLWKKGKGTWDKGWGITAFEALSSLIMTGSQSIRSRHRLSFSWTGLFNANVSWNANWREKKYEKHNHERQESFLFSSNFFKFRKKEKKKPSVKGVGKKISLQQVAKHVLCRWYSSTTLYIPSLKEYSK